MERKRVSEKERERENERKGEEDEVGSFGGESTERKKF